MQEADKIYLEFLKKEIVSTMRETYPGIKPDLSEWKGQEITDFQEDLRIKVKAHVSEKWFYTHLKAQNKSLPRIDILNLLCRYSGHQNWEDFKFSKGAEPAVGLEKKANRMFLIIPALVIIVMAVFYSLFMLFNTREYHFSFYDAQSLQPIKGTNIKVTVLKENESPIVYLCDADGNVNLETNSSQVKMLVESPFYKTDTITRFLRKFTNNEKIGLQINDNALMLNYFTQTKVEDWNKRRNMLDSLFADDAIIYRIYGKQQSTGMELMNKEEFIDFMSVPSSSLKGMEILDIRNSGNKIKILRYRINEQLQ
ncbi:MAG: hypothetical protein IPH88_19750 [Bacteroidales bacterium]|nr:hypothetical protein [Bacteroidales bacterium]